MLLLIFFFFFSSRRRHTRLVSDWSSDVCSSDLMYEQNFQKMRSRARTPTDDSSVNDWLSDLQDTVQTVYAGVKASLIPKVLELKINGNYSSAVGTIETRNTSGVTPTIASARAQRLPAFEDTVLRLETSLRYSFLKSWAANLGYIFERSEERRVGKECRSGWVPYGEKKKAKG